MLPIEPKDYSDGRTKQAFKDSTDVNKMLRKAQKAGTLSHLVRHGAVYGDFSDVPDLLTAQNRINAGKAIYDELPSEIRKEFPDMFKFFEYVNDPANKDDLVEKLPDLAAPGRQVPAVRRSAATEANPAVRSAVPEAASEVAAEPPVNVPAEPVASSST